MTVISSAAPVRCQEPPPTALERMLLQVLRSLERDIETRTGRRARTRPARELTRSLHGQRRAEAVAASHCGLFPR